MNNTKLILKSEQANLKTRFMLFLDKMWRQKTLLLMSLPFLIWVVIFRYLPIGGWILAFQNYRPALPLTEQTWVGLENFRQLFQDDMFLLTLRNSFVINIIRLVFGMFFSILLALVLNEVRRLTFKKIAQTISYLPYFISWVVAATLVRNALSTEGGIVNDILLRLNLIESPVMFLGIPELFWWIIGATHVWKTIGFGAIVYLAAITGINPELYEAARIDGAGRLRQIWHITLPGIKPVIVILLIMNMGWLLQSFEGFEQVYLLQSGRVMEYSRIFQIFELEYGIRMFRYSFATAVGIFRSVVSIVLVFSANYIAKKLGQERLV